MLIGVVVLVIIGAGVGFGLHSKSSGATMKVAWSVNATKGTQSTNTALAGSWATPTSVIDGRSDGVIAYSLKNGAQIWGWQVPSGSTGCHMSTTTAGGIGVLAYGEKFCDQLVAFKLDTGQQVWPHAISLGDPKGHSTPSATFVAVDGDVMAVVAPDDTLGAYDLTTGKKLWQKSEDDFDASLDCDLWGASVIGTTAYALHTCTPASGGLNYSYIVTGYNAQTGAKTWTGQIRQLGDQDTVSLWSDPADGYLFVADSSDSSAQLLSFSVPKGSGSTTPTTVKLDDYDTNDAFTPSDQNGGQQVPHGYAVYGHTLYIEGARPHDSRVNNVNAIDLASGKKLWTQAIPGDSIAILGADASGVHTVASKDDVSPFQLVTFSASAGKKTEGASIDDTRINIQTEDQTYLDGKYLVDLPSATFAGDAEIVVLSGAKIS
ncbi:hypothetical protein GCM10023322_80950 [Rugosimonospora acidiphila]|uniref:Pyrrolo-quinoline quinone repeat domain-containing protein n=1 Tax=Rugosimonospora acidiphila TaxID=556531 RepID=A0ABP9SRE6_9ACTN